MTTKTTPSNLAKETTEAIFDYDDQIPASQNSMAYDYACIIQRALDKSFSEGFQKGQTYDKPQTTPFKNDDLMYVRDAVHAFHRLADFDKDGNVDLSQLRDDEVVVYPGKIYRRLVK